MTDLEEDRDERPYKVAEDVGLLDGHGPAPGEDYPGWPNDGERDQFECPLCGDMSTLAYRCSECGYDPASETSGG